MCLYVFHNNIILVTLVYIELLVKCYSNGALSSYIHSLHLSDAAKIRGPLPTMSTDVDGNRKYD